ncbi:ribosome-binding factor A [Aliiroseovarius zhejiangensis]|uniref:Ribosome-binding factor A n=2 Tax=Aliiroseovarius zhejiangensis TaxID=1632025 RepID=A0ABQ3J887_9RHOB|nr:ribosome-binding factor A [Aliiroseovarius zhejiangensis]
MALMAKNRFQDTAGPTQRQLRIAELIRRTLSEALMRGDVHDPDLGRMSITIGEVRVTPDLSIATVFALPLGGKDGDLAIKALARNKGELRRILGKALKIKHTPDLRFMVDETFDQMDKTNRLLSQERVQRDLRAKDDEDGSEDT